MLDPLLGNDRETNIFPLQVHAQGSCHQDDLIEGKQPVVD
jgi:hypothetical protein